MLDGAAIPSKELNSFNPNFCVYNFLKDVRFILCYEFEIAWVVLFCRSDIF